MEVKDQEIFFNFQSAICDNCQNTVISENEGR